MTTIVRIQVAHAPRNPFVDEFALVAFDNAGRVVRPAQHTGAG
jgi:hypothetical protein